MTDPSHTPDPSSPERNPLGLGPRDRESSNTGSTDDTSYAARGADPYRSGDPNPGARRGASTDASTPADPDVPSSDEP